jgi:hypothetical protein
LQYYFFMPFMNIFSALSAAASARRAAASALWAAASAARALAAHCSTSWAHLSVEAVSATAVLGPQAQPEIMVKANATTNSPDKILFMTLSSLSKQETNQETN